MVSLTHACSSRPSGRRRPACAPSTPTCFVRGRNATRPKDAWALRLIEIGFSRRRQLRVNRRFRPAGHESDRVCALGRRGGGGAPSAPRAPASVVALCVCADKPERRTFFFFSTTAGAAFFVLAATPNCGRTALFNLPPPRQSRPEGGPTPTAGVTVDAGKSLLSFCRPGTPGCRVASTLAGAYSPERGDSSADDTVPTPAYASFPPGPTVAARRRPETCSFAVTARHQPRLTLLS